MGLYYITADCIGCAECLAICEDDAIEEIGEIYRITSACTECGACEPICPVQAIIRGYEGAPPPSSQQG